MRGRKIEIVNVMLVMADLLFVEIAEGIAHGAGSVGGEVAFFGFEKTRGVGQGFLRGELDFRMGKAGEVNELPGDLRREG